MRKFLRFKNERNEKWTRRDFDLQEKLQILITHIKHCLSKPKIHIDQNSLPSSNSSPLPVNKSVEVKLPNLAECFSQKF